jgi:hypothetical protein
MEGTAPQCLPEVLGLAWLSLSSAQREAFLGVTAASQTLALSVACLVAEATGEAALRAPSSLIGRKAEKDVLDIAARDLQQVVLHSATTPQSMDGQIPLYIQGRRGRIGIEVKTYQSAVGADEVLKFHRDACSNDFAVAVLVSTRSPIAHKRKGITVERATTTRGLTWMVYVCPVHEMSGLVTCALALALELAKEDRPHVVSLPEDIGESLQREVHALAGTKRKLRDEDGRAQAARDQVTDALTAMQQRLTSMVETLVRRGDDEIAPFLAQSSGKE